MGDLFIGSALSAIDARGALALPDYFCVTIQSRDLRDDLFVACDDAIGCLVVCDAAAIAARGSADVDTLRSRSVSPRPRGWTAAGGSRSRRGYARSARGR